MLYNKNHHYNLLNEPHTLTDLTGVKSIQNINNLYYYCWHNDLSPIKLYSFHSHYHLYRDLYWHNHDYHYYNYHNARVSLHLCQKQCQCKQYSFHLFMCVLYVTGDVRVIKALLVPFVYTAKYDTRVEKTEKFMPDLIYVLLPLKGKGCHVNFALNKSFLSYSTYLH